MFYNTKNKIFFILTILINLLIIASCYADGLLTQPQRCYEEYPEKDSKAFYSKCVLDKEEVDDDDEQEKEEKNKDIHENEDKGGTLDVIKIYTSKEPSESEKKLLEEKN
jgi:hypothetical protein